MLHAMIDLETLDTAVTSAVLSLGVALFNDDGLWPHHDLEVRFDLDEQLRGGRTVSASTIQWWMLQSEAARSAAFGKPARSVPVLRIEEVQRLLTGLLNGVDHVWCRGLAFDIAILDHMFASRQLRSPWKYSAVRDSRTILDHIAPDALPKRAGEAHNALDDARHEAACVVEALATLQRNHSAWLESLTAPAMGVGDVPAARADSQLSDGILPQFDKVFTILWPESASPNKSVAMTDVPNYPHW